MANDVILKLRDVKTYFPVEGSGREKLFVRAVDGITLDVRQGEVIGLVGESGSGKSTLAYTVMGINLLTGGSIEFDGTPINVPYQKRSKTLKRRMQIVFQDPASSLNQEQTIHQILALPLKLFNKGLRGAALTHEVVRLLEMVQLPAAFMYKSPSSIGGGERQMVCIARALACAPEFLVLDEPTSALDVSIQAKVINMLIRFQQERSLTYLFITHDLSLMRNIADRVVIMYLGKVCEVADAVTFFTKPLHPYTRMLLSSIPVVSEEEEKLKPEKVESTGEIPSPVNIPSGCSFHLRCPFKRDICSQIDPEEQEIEPGHTVRCHLYGSTACREEE